MILLYSFTSLIPGEPLAQVVNLRKLILGLLAGLEH
jgi:hypothetical protein